MTSLPVEDSSAAAWRKNAGVLAGFLAVFLHVLRVVCILTEIRPICAVLRFKVIAGARELAFGTVEFLGADTRAGSGRPTSAILTR